MSFDAQQARQDLLDTVAEATDGIGVALAAVGEAYEQLDAAAADRLEDELFRPLQAAYGRARRTHGDFASRHGLPARTFAPAARPSAAHDVRALVDAAADAAADADVVISTLQDSMLPVEVGDPELRAGLAEVRTLLGDLPGRAQRFVGVLGR